MFPGKEDPLLILLDALEGGNPSDAIVRSEKRGQSLFVQSQVLPKECNCCTREQLEQMGIVFGEDADDLFVYVTLPAGWHKEATDRDMWSILLDDKGRERAGIFYKAAFYDRSAHISLYHRFVYSAHPVGGYEMDSSKTPWHTEVLDSEKSIWSSETIAPMPDNDASREDFSAWYYKRDKLDQQARDWLDNNYPDWRNPLAYWE